MVGRTINDEVTMEGGTDLKSGRLRVGASILNRYLVLGELGQGGMGVVYRALDTVGGVEVAVKMLPPEVAHNSDAMDAIRINYQIVRTLRHSNIVAVTNLEKDRRGDYYLVMDLANGENLSHWQLTHPTATRTEKIALLRQIASALDYAHGEKIIHRDVKPANVMVDAVGRVKVLDFGLAAEVRSSQSRTSQAVTSKSGTPHYKAPEQWLGQPQNRAADIYSFAVLAFKLFFDRLPFEADDLGVLCQAVLSAPVPKMPGVPSFVNAAFAKGLAKAPGSRFASCADFLDALEGKKTVGAPASPSNGNWLVRMVRGFASACRSLFRRAPAVEAAPQVEAAAPPTASVPQNHSTSQPLPDEPRTTGPQAEDSEVPPSASEDASRDKPKPERHVAEDWKDEKQKLLDLLADEQRKRKAAEAEASDAQKVRHGISQLPLPGAAPSEKAKRVEASLSYRQEQDALSDVRTLLEIKRDRALELKKKVDPFRSEKDGFELHLAVFDSAIEKIAKLSLPQTSNEGRLVSETVTLLVNTLEFELKWMNDNQHRRDAVKRVATDIASTLDKDLAAFNASTVEKTAFDQGNDLRKKGLEAFRKGEFTEANDMLLKARSLLAAARAGAKAFKAAQFIRAAVARKQAGQWQQCLNEAEKALAIDASSAEARALRNVAASHLAPSLKLVTKIGDEVVVGAKIQVGDKVYLSPVVFDKLGKNTAHGPYEVSYVRDGRSYCGRFDPIDITWIGPRMHVLSLTRSETSVPAETKKVTLPGGLEIEFAWCPSGQDLKGKDVGGFWLGKTEVTQGQWKSVMGSDPSFFKGTDRPVEQVSWTECQAFCRKVGQGLRLPTVREWEYACRAGSSGDWGKRLNGEEGPLDLMGWHEGNSGFTTHPVGMKEPNAWGLYDMHGNVWEWCEDAVVEGRARRGGSWVNSPWYCSAEHQSGLNPNTRLDRIGFRVACSPN